MLASKDLNSPIWTTIHLQLKLNFFQKQIKYAPGFLIQIFCKEAEKYDSGFLWKNFMGLKFPMNS